MCGCTSGGGGCYCMGMVLNYHSGHMRSRTLAIFPNLAQVLTRLLRDYLRIHEPACYHPPDSLWTSYGSGERRPSPGLSSKLGLSSPSQKRKGAYGHDHHPGHARPLPRRGRGCVAMITATPSLSQKKKVVCVDDNHSPPLPMRGRVYIDHHHKVIYGHGH